MKNVLLPRCCLRKLCPRLLQALSGSFEILSFVSFAFLVISMLRFDAAYRTAIFTGLADLAPLFIPMAVVWVGIQAAKVARAQADTAKRAAIGQRQAARRADDAARKKLKMDLFDKRYEVCKRIRAAVDRVRFGIALNRSQMRVAVLESKSAILNEYFEMNWLFKNAIAEAMRSDLCRGFDQVDAAFMSEDSAQKEHALMALAEISGNLEFSIREYMQLED